jgi:uncharacterized protein YndB with AHSA1/START domain
MSTTQPLGHRATRDGNEHVVFTRTFAAPLGDVWAACTEPERMERWIGTWTGDPASGEIRFRMTAEGDDVPEEVYLVEVCEPPRRLVLRSRDAAAFLRRRVRAAGGVAAHPRAGRGRRGDDPDLHPGRP